MCVCVGGGGGQVWKWGMKRNNLNKIEEAHVNETKGVVIIGGGLENIEKTISRN